MAGFRLKTARDFNSFDLAGGLGDDAPGWFVRGKSAPCPDSIHSASTPLNSGPLFTKRRKKPGNGYKNEYTIYNALAPGMAGAKRKGSASGAAKRHAGLIKIGLTQQCDPFPRPLGEG
ncbi:MAG: hypothetical protein ACXWUF_08155 [Methylomagnum sp.]